MIAVVVALPGYLEWTREQRKRPDMRLRLAIFEEATEEERWIDEQVDRIVVACPDFVFRANVRNEGDKVLRWAILNIVVRRECEIGPRQGDRPLLISGSNDVSRRTDFPSIRDRGVQGEERGRTTRRAVA